jgi:hypothetical protein
MFCNVKFHYIVAKNHIIKKNVYLQVEIHVVGNFLQLHINNKQKVHQTHHQTYQTIFCTFMIYDILNPISPNFYMTQHVATNGIT